MRALVKIERFALEVDFLDDDVHRMVGRTEDWRSCCSDSPLPFLAG